ncbi:MAG: fimbrillin family protein, partial [Bacteroidia bacterium]|nr:fimbrillin family protein [Bacteroidia bacterium]
MRSFILLVAAFFTIQISLQAQITYTFNYTGSSQTVALPAGNYSIQCWGANGGTSAGGKGGYSTGSITITTPTTLHVYVGGAGTSTNSTGSGNAAGGWNGGGNGSCYSSYGSSGGGGGGTDIRTTQNTTYANRIIVAGGGGGGSVGTYGYSGGH